MLFTSRHWPETRTEARGQDGGQRRVAREEEWELKQPGAQDTQAQAPLWNVCFHRTVDGFRQGIDKGKSGYMCEHPVGAQLAGEIKINEGTWRPRESRWRSGHQ